MAATSLSRMGVGGGWGVRRKEYSFCGTVAKKLENLRPVAARVMILWLREHQDSEVAIFIDTNL